MATHLFSQAAAYRRSHPSVSQAEAVQICSRANKKKAAAPAKKKAVGKAKKSAAPAKKKARKKIKISIGTTKPATRIKKAVRRVVKAITPKISGIAGVSMAELERNILHLQNLEKIHASTVAMLKDGKNKAAWPDLRRQLAKNVKAIEATKKHISALKRTI